MESSATVIVNYQHEEGVRDPVTLKDKNPKQLISVTCVFFNEGKVHRDVVVSFSGTHEPY
jgi:hypothetical protein